MPSFQLEPCEPQIKALFETGTKTFLACTGAGLGAANILWQVPGASATLVGAALPYAQDEFNAFIGRDWSATGAGYCSLSGAIALAQECYVRCQRAAYAKNDYAAPLVGIGLSAAAATSRELRGGTRIYAAIRTRKGTHTVSISTTQGQLTRKEEGLLADVLVLNLLFWEAGLSQHPFPEGIGLTSCELVPALDGCGAILAPAPLAPNWGPLPLPFMLDCKGEPAQQVEQLLDPSRHIIVPGSFNPLTCAHDAMAQHISKVLGKEPVFEICLKNAQKGAVDEGEIQRRCLQFSGRWPVLVSDLTLFIDKAKRYNNCSFALGYDIVAAIFSAKFYTTGGLEAAVAYFREHGVVFHVFDRHHDGEVKTAHDLNLSTGGRYADLLKRIEFTEMASVSSTKVRTGGAAV